MMATKRKTVYFCMYLKHNLMVFYKQKIFQAKVGEKNEEDKFYAQYNSLQF
jgi:hypothetical protein